MLFGSRDNNKATPAPNIGSLTRSDIGRAVEAAQAAYQEAHTKTTAFFGGPDTVADSVVKELQKIRHDLFENGPLHKDVLQKLNGQPNVDHVVRVVTKMRETRDGLRLPTTACIFDQCMNALVEQLSKNAEFAASMAKTQGNRR